MRKLTSILAGAAILALATPILAAADEPTNCQPWAELLAEVHAETAERAVWAGRTTAGSSDLVLLVDPRNRSWRVVEVQRDGARLACPVLGGEANHMGQGWRLTKVAAAQGQG